MSRASLLHRGVAAVPAVLLLWGCSSVPPPTVSCTTLQVGRLCVVTDSAQGYSTRTLENNGKVYVSTCEGATCQDFKEVP